MEQRLSIVTLGVGNVAASTAFYRRLGWRQSSTGSNDEITFFQLGGIALALFGDSALAGDAGCEQPAAGGFSRVTLAYNTRDRDEVDAVLAEAEKAGAQILKPAANAFWGGYSGYFADPDGHAWEVAWNPHFSVGEDGAMQLPE